MTKCHEFKVFSISIARKLAELNYHPIRIEPNRKHPQLSVFVYPDTKQLRIAFDLIQRAARR